MPPPPFAPKLPLLLTLAALASAPAIGQPADPPPADSAPERPDARLNPLLADPSLQQEVLERTSRPEAGAVLMPTRAAITVQVVPNEPLDRSRLPLADDAGWARADVLLPEGTFLVRRVGEVVRLRTGGLGFVPAAQADAPLDPAMPILPCEVTGRLAALLDGAEGTLWMALTGEVFVYQGRNYLLPTAFASAAGPAEEPDAAEGPATPAEEGDTAEPPAPPPEDQGADPRIEALVRELEADREERRGLDLSLDTSADTTPAPGDAAPPSPRIEGKLLLNRRGRMVRGPGGGWIIALDNDADAPDSALALPERINLLPGRLVQEMERQAERRGEAWTFEISGNLYRQGERVYIVPRMFVSLPDDEVDPLQ